MSIPRGVVAIVPLAAGCAVGWLSWPHTLTTSILLLILLPVVGPGHSRFLLAFGYFLAASVGIVHGSVQFFGIGTSVYLGLAFWVASSGFLALPYALPGRWLILSPLLDVVPPLGFFGWASPLLGMASWGAFPAVCLFGIWAAWVYFKSGSTKGVGQHSWKSWVAPWILLIFALPYPAVPPQPKPQPNGWVGIHTGYGLLNGYGMAEIRRDEQLEQLVMHKLQDPRTKVVVLPEAAAGMWYAGTAQLWQPVIDWTKTHEQAVLLGVEYPTGRGYEDALLRIQQGKTKVFSDDIAVPVSMWHPWKTGGALDHLGGIEAGTVMGERFYYLICYEQLLTLPGLHLLWNEIVDGKPAVLVGVANDWWTKGTNIAESQAISLQAWGSLLGVPVVSAVNG